MPLVHLLKTWLPAAPYAKEIRPGTLKKETVGLTTFPPALNLLGDPSLLRSRSFQQKQTRAQRISWLKKNGYSHLVSNFEQNRGYPWESILSVDSPILIEQLSLIFHFSPSKNVLDFIETLVSPLQKYNKLIENAHYLEVQKKAALLGKLAFLLQLKKKKPSSITVEWVEKKFERALYKKCKSFYHSSLLASNPLSYRNTQLPLFLSEYLITPKGDCNIGLMSALLETKELYSLVSSVSAKTLQSRFYQLLMQPRLRFLLSSASYSKETKSSSVNHLICSALNLDAQTSLTDRHVKQTALAALLTHFRQNKCRSCFASAICLSELEEGLEGCLKEFIALLKHGKLERTFYGEKRSIPFLLAMLPNNLDTPIALDKNGYVERHNQKIHLSETPEMKKIFLYFSIKNPKKFVTNLLKNKRIKKPLTLGIILHSLTKNPEIFSSGCFYHESVYHNPLLFCWRNAVAGMAEIRADSMLQSEIFSSILYGINVDYKGLPNQFAHLTNHLILNITKNLLQKSELLYHPLASIKNYIEQDAFPVDGFLMYDRSDKRKPIESEKDFQCFVKKIIEEAAQDLIDSSHFSEKTDWTKKIAKALTEYVDTDRFLDRTLNHFCSKIHSQDCLTKSNISIKATPWLSYTGNNTEKTLQVYKDISRVSKRTIHTQDPTILLKNIIEELKRDKVFLKKKLHESPSFCIPCRVQGVHAFTLLPGHPSFAPLWMGCQKSSRRFEEMKKDPSPYQAIVFANTNWSENEEDLYLCLAYNPNSKKIEICICYEDGSNLSFLDQTKWAQRKWDLFF